MSKIRLAIVGAGHLGRIHARLAASNELFEVVAVADPCPDAREKVESELGLQTTCGYHELFRSIDAAIVATPTQSHYEVASSLLRAGVHCLVEKPLSHEIEQARRLVQIAKNRNRVLQVGHVERFNPIWTTAQPALGVPKYVEAQRCGPFSGRSTDIGVVFDLMVHDLDLILSVDQSEIKSVSASGVALLGKHEDLAEARLEFASGLIAVLRASRVARNPSRRMQWYTTEGFVDIDFSGEQVGLVRLSDAIQQRKVDVDALSPNQRAEVKQRLYEDFLLTDSIPVDSRNAILDEHHDFAVSILAGELPVVSGETAARVIEVADQIRSAIVARQWEAQWSSLKKPAAQTRSIPLPIQQPTNRLRRKAG